MSEFKVSCSPTILDVENPNICNLTSVFPNLMNVMLDRQSEKRVEKELMFRLNYRMMTVNLHF